MKAGLKVLALSGVLMFVGETHLAMASGIPTVDVATIAQLAMNAQAQATQAADALTEAKNSIQQAKDQYEDFKGLTTGNDRLGDFLDNPEINRILPLENWAKLYESAQDIAELRRRYGLLSDNQKVQQSYDRVLSVMSALEQCYEASTERLNNANALRRKLNAVVTPQEKEDLQLRYQHEHLELQVQQQRLDQMQMLVQLEEKARNQQRIKDFKDYVKGKRSDLPQY